MIIKMLLEHFSLLELTQPLSPNAPTWNGSCGFCLEIKKDYDQEFRVQQIKCHAGVGTHMDAPSHRFKGAASINNISLEKLIVQACVIDVTKIATAEYEISVQDVLQYEAKYGVITPNSLVIGYTGWSHLWSDPDAYRNVDEKGQMHFPAFSAAAAELLLKRKIAGIAIDTLSPDCLDHSFPVHKLILGAGLYIIENVADCSKLPPKGAYVIALPMNALSATEAPIRMLGLVPSKRVSTK